MLASADLRESEGRASVDILVEAGLVGRRATPGSAGYAFRHALIRDAAYGALLHAQRQRVHAGIAAAIERLHPEMVEREPHLLARHCAEAGQVEKAINYHLAAAGMAARRAALAIAAEQLEAGVGLLARMQEGLGRDRLELALRRAQGRVLTAARGFGATEVGEVFARARELRGADLAFDAIAHYGEFAHYLVRGNLQVAFKVADELAEASSGFKESILGYAACATRGIALTHMGQLVAAEHLLEEALEA